MAMKSSNKVAESRKLLENPYAYINGNGGYDVTIPESGTMLGKGVLQSHASHRKVKNKYAWIEQKVREIQKTIWRNRSQLWFGGAPSDPVQLLDPAVASSCIGYEYVEVEYLGENRSSEVAGMIDRAGKRITVSRRLPYNTLRFTAAHELGHAVLHKQTMMHRDRPIDGGHQYFGPRDELEIEADKFATYFLMPEKLIRERFKQIYGVSEAYELTEDRAFAFGQPEIQALLERCDSTRDLSRILAKAEHYNGRSVRSLASQFGVSVEAMAIRIEEIGLVEE